MIYNWYPGHMLKAKKEIIQIMSKIDIVIEVVDSRVPLSSHNKMLEKLINDKPRILVFTKSDYVDINKLDKFLKNYQEQGYQNYVVNLKVNSNTKLMKTIEMVAKPVKDKYLLKGIDKKVKILIIGMPNVGKSTLINYLVKKNRVIVQNKPGITKKQQWIKLNEKMELLDTPGVLVPKLENEEISLSLAACSIIKEQVVNIDDVSLFLLKKVYYKNKKMLFKRYDKLSVTEFDVEKIYQQIGASVGIVLKDDNYEPISKIIIRDYRNKKLGKMILDD